MPAPSINALEQRTYRSTRRQMTSLLKEYDALEVLRCIEDMYRIQYGDHIPLNSPFYLELNDVFNRLKLSEFICKVAFDFNHEGTSLVLRIDNRTTVHTREEVVYLFPLVIRSVPLNASKFRNSILRLFSSRRIFAEEFDTTWSQHVEFDGEPMVFDIQRRGEGDRYGPFKGSTTSLTMPEIRQWFYTVPGDNTSLVSTERGHPFRITVGINNIIFEEVFEHDRVLLYFWKHEQINAKVERVIKAWSRPPLVFGQPKTGSSLYY